MGYRYPGRITFLENGRGEQIAFRSRLEARWATFFNATELEWEYEPATFRLSNRQSYTPDFYLPEVGWLEIKASRADALAAEPKLRLFARERHKMIERSGRNEFYTVVGSDIGFDVPTVHRWIPEPTEIYFFEDIWLLFCGTQTRATAERAGVHVMDWLKMCFWKARQGIDPMRPLEDYEFAYRHHELGTSFGALSRATREGRVMPLTELEIRQLKRSETGE